MPGQCPTDVNTANLRALRRVPGIGDALAHRILAERQRGGPFADATALERVRGIGRRKAKELSAHLLFHPPAATPDAAAQPEGRPAPDTMQADPRPAPPGPEPQQTVSSSTTPAPRGPALVARWPLLLAQALLLGGLVATGHALQRAPGLPGIGAALVLGALLLLCTAWLLPGRPHRGWLPGCGVLLLSGCALLLARVPTALPLALLAGTWAVLLVGPWVRMPHPHWHLAALLGALPALILLLQGGWAWLGEQLPLGRWVLLVWVAVMLARHVTALARQRSSGWAIRPRP